jgi:cytochrome c55X
LDLSVKRKAELVYMLDQDCGSCHGLTLKGGLGPALTLDRMKSRSVKQITKVILDGVPDTPMPPWRPILSEQEARYLAQVLISGDRGK